MAAALAGCGRAPAETPAGGGPGRLPRQHAISAADLEVGEGTDFCDQYPRPHAEPFDPGPGSILNILPGEHVLGSEDALITMLLYHDLASEASPELIASLEALVEERPDEVRVVYRHLPGTGNSALAGEAVEAAYAQAGNEGFWRMVDVLNEHHSEWRLLAAFSFRDVLPGYAEEAGLDGDQLSADLESGRFTPLMEAATFTAGQSGISQPTLIVNELNVPDPPTTLDELRLIVQVVGLRTRYAEAPPMVIDPQKDYAAWIVTERGTIAIDLFADLAPATVNNFAYLACVGYYDGLTFHRVVPGFVAQAGDPTATGLGGPGYTIPDEFEGIGLTFDRAGWLSMAHTSAPNSAGGQFFITLGPAEHLNGAFTIFGEVVGGLEAAQRLAARDPQTAPPDQPGDAIETVIVRAVP